MRYPLILTSLLMVSGQNGMALDSSSFRAATDVTAEVRQLTLDDYQVISAGPDAEGLLSRLFLYSPKEDTESREVRVD